MSWFSKILGGAIGGLGGGGGGGQQELPTGFLDPAAARRAKEAFWKRYLEGISPAAQAQMYEKAKEAGITGARRARQLLLRSLARAGIKGPARAYKEEEMQAGLIPELMGAKRDIGLASEQAKMEGLGGYAGLAGLTGKMAKKKRPWYQKLLGGALGSLSMGLGYGG